jgi:hypothetical protein
VVLRRVPAERTRAPQQISARRPSTRLIADVQFLVLTIS